MTDDEHFERTVTNAERLWSDSKLLNAHSREKSAIILAVFAIEELGKALITSWGVKNIASKREHPTHAKKQSATFALLCANEMLKKNRKRMQKQIEQGTINFLKIGPFSHQFAWTRQGFFDGLRMAATYADKDPKFPTELADQFDSELPTELQEWFRKAILTTRNIKAMTLAAAIYANGLGKL
ncbi:AbiV family abortive infection protein [Parasphingorhabdus sp.]|uniref:AbiV family abortive infection protein n=2 Tax=Parasphingorhabdus sp. TaxID=2709688 RepID=UPI002B2775E9|nr:AbiV family abortive infection protein [Parasphingorhabdus sp.]